MSHLLPANVVFEVLLRLGVRDLSRFRCVCKLWYDLISDPYFLQLHSLRPEQSPRLLLQSASYDSTEFSDEATIHLHSANIKDGVVQWQTKKEIFSFHVPRSDAKMPNLCSKSLNLICLEGYEHIYLCNPTTQELLTIPKPLSVEDVYDTVGFGYYDVASAKKYKVVRFSHDPWSGDDKRCEVFDLGSDHWRRVEDPPFPLIGSAPFVNGAIYRMADYDEDDYEFDLPGHQAMVSFDIKTEKFQELPLPEGILDPQNLHLMELDGLLCMAEADYGSHMSAYTVDGLDLWLLKDHCNAVWVKQYRIDLKGLNWNDFDFPIIVDGRRILMLVHRTEKLVYYDLQFKNFSEVNVEVEGLLNSGLRGLLNCGLYVENLSF